MISIKIITKSDKGKLALEHHVAESVKLSKKQKVTFKMLGYKQEVINLEPYVVEITLNNKYFQQLVRSVDIVRKIDEVMGENGALRERDYAFEITE